MLDNANLSSIHPNRENVNTFVSKKNDSLIQDLTTDIREIEYEEVSETSDIQKQMGDSKDLSSLRQSTQSKTHRNNLTNENITRTEMNSSGENFVMDRLTDLRENMQRGKSF